MLVNMELVVSTDNTSLALVGALAAWTFVNPAPSPLKVPLRFAPLAPSVSTLAGNCSGVRTPLNCSVESVPEDSQRRRRCRNRRRKAWR